MNRRRSSFAMIAAGLLAGAVSVTGITSSAAQEAPPAPAGLFSYELDAGGRGYSMFYEDGSGMRYGEATVPESSSALATGPIGLGLASMAWPGPVAGNAGSLILVLSPDAPEEASDLNYPVRAEARTGQEPPTVTNEIPGAVMTATATAEAVEADARVDSVAGEDGTFGPSRARTKSFLEGGKGIAEASSVVEKISLAGGVVKIDSVTSTAKALTDGTKASGEAATVVSGMTIGGQPATIGEDGLTIGESDQPLNAVANQIAKQALAQSGVEMVLGAPVKELEGSSAVVSAPSLVITWESEGGIFGFVVGGARAAVAGSPALDDAALGDVDLGDTPAAPVEAPGGGTATLDETGAGSGGGDTPVSDVPAGGGEPQLAPPSDAGGGDGGEVALDEAAPARSLSKPVKASYLLLGLLAAVLVAIGMRRLGDDVLAERVAGAACALEGDGS